VNAGGRGVGSAVGAVIGTVVLTVLPEALRFLKEWYMVLYGGRRDPDDYLPPDGGQALRGASRASRMPDFRRCARGRRDPACITRHCSCAAAAAQAKGDPVIAVAGVTMRFGGLSALDGVSLDVARGSVHAVIGPNGSGKTTFLNVLSGAYAAQEGSVLLDGVELIGRRPNAIARAGLSRTFQNIRVYKSLTVLENVMRAPPARGCRSMARIPAQSRPEPPGSACRSTICAKRASGAPVRRLAAFAARPAGSLAYAQQRLLEIARAVATRPKVLLLDEPAAGMNPQESLAADGDHRGTRQAGDTVIFVEHNVRL